MTHLPSDYFRPLCPAHHTVMVIAPDALVPGAFGTSRRTIEGHDCECPLDGCPNHYSPGFGYFTIEPNLDHLIATGQTTLKILRSVTQVICGEHEYSMFLQAVDLKAGRQAFRCPDRTCPQVLELSLGSPPAYWLGPGFFKRARSASI